MPVLSSTDFQKKNPQEPMTVKVRKTLEKPKHGYVKKIRFLLPHAPEGTSVIGMMLDGTHRTIKLVDGIYVLPTNMKAAKKKLWIEQLFDAGFLDASEVEKSKKAKKAKPEKVRLRHIELIEAEDYTIEILGEEIPLEVKDGIITTDNPAVVEALKEKEFEVLP